MARPEGLQPPTLGSEDQCSMQLSYGRPLAIVFHEVSFGNVCTHLQAEDVRLYCCALVRKYLETCVSKFPPIGLIYRCSGPNCGKLRHGGEDGWWLLWTSVENGVPVLSVSPWDDDNSHIPGKLFACGENCAHKLQSVFMANITANQRARAAQEQL